ncbi:hypothetical protein T265_15561, partial [Opisthorchis viverrini]
PFHWSHVAKPCLVSSANAPAFWTCPADGDLGNASLSAYVLFHVWARPDIIIQAGQQKKIAISNQMEHIRCSQTLRLVSQMKDVFLRVPIHLTRLLKTLRHPTTGFALLGAHQTDCDKYNHLQINLVFTGDSSESLVYGRRSSAPFHWSHVAKPCLVSSANAPAFWTCPADGDLGNASLSAYVLFHVWARPDIIIQAGQQKKIAISNQMEHIRCSQTLRLVSQMKDVFLRVPIHLTRLLKTLRHPTTGFALLGAHQTGCDKYNHLQINLVFTGDWSESLVYGRRSSGRRSPRVSVNLMFYLGCRRSLTGSRGLSFSHTHKHVALSWPIGHRLSAPPSQRSNHSCADAPTYTHWDLHKGKPNPVKTHRLARAQGAGRQPLHKSTDNHGSNCGEKHVPAVRTSTKGLSHPISSLFDLLPFHIVFIFIHVATIQKLLLVHIHLLICTMTIVTCALICSTFS